MFDNWRERLHNVQHDLSEGLKNLTTKAKEVGKTTRKSEIPNSPEFVVKPHLDAGAELLNKFQQQWIELHHNIDGSAKKAIEADIEVQKLVTKCEKQNEAILQFHSQLAALPKLAEEIQSATVIIGSLEGTFEEIEGVLIYLEELCDEEEFERNKMGHSNNMLAYREIKRQEQETLRVQLQAEYNQKVREMEQSEQAKMKERQKTFQDVFNEDMQHYKESGEMNRPIFRTQTSSVSITSVEDVDLDDVMDKDELDDFLGPDSTTPSNDTDHTPSTEKDTEDDGTAAIEVQQDRTELDDDTFAEEAESPPNSGSDFSDVDPKTDGQSNTETTGVS
ncbi:dysbindin-like [Ptychodera flava]|uniref:dysbindin-like n=1 Tax=Ptychodera flava TaxID=63121 RepID=UPI003969D23F